MHFELRGPTDQFSQLQMLSVVSFEAIVQFCRVAQDSVVMYKCEHFLRQDMTNKCKNCVNLDNFICNDKIPEKRQEMNTSVSKFNLQ